MRNEKTGIGQNIAKRLRARIPRGSDDELSDDEILMLEALDTIERLRWSDPEQIKAEGIIRRAAALIENPE